MVFQQDAKDVPIVVPVQRDLVALQNHTAAMQTSLELDCQQTRLLEETMLSLPDGHLLAGCASQLHAAGDARQVHARSTSMATAGVLCTTHVYSFVGCRTSHGDAMHHNASRGSIKGPVETHYQAQQHSRMPLLPAAVDASGPAQLPPLHDTLQEGQPLPCSAAGRIARRHSTQPAATPQQHPNSTMHQQERRVAGVESKQTEACVTSRNFTEAV